MQDFLKLKLQAKGHSCSYPPFCFGQGWKPTVRLHLTCPSNRKVTGKPKHPLCEGSTSEGQYTIAVHHTSNGAAAHTKNLAFFLEKLFIFKAIRLQTWPPCIVECLGLAALCQSMLTLLHPLHTPARKHPEDAKPTRPTRGVNIAAVTLYFVVGF